jgi:hypothetical protein
MENVKVTNQGDLGVCFAHSAVKVYEAKLKATGMVDPKFKASIFAAFVKNKEKDKYLDKKYFYQPDSNRSHVAFGNFCGLINQLKESGVCDAEDLEDSNSLNPRKTIFQKMPELLSGKTEKRAKSTELLQIIEKQQMEEFKALPPNLGEIENLEHQIGLKKILLYETKLELQSLKESLKAMSPVVIRRTTSKLEHEKHEIEQELFILMKDIEFEKDRYKRNHIDRCPKTRSLNDLRTLNFQIENISIKVSPLEYLRKFVDKKCKSSVKLPEEFSNLKCSHVITQSVKQEVLENFLDQEFSKKQAASPIAIDYKPAFLMRVERENITNVGHSSLIIGRKIIDGSCHYLIRNSIGKDCGLYKPGFHCEKGDVWVKDSELFSNSTAFENPFSTN